MNNNKPLLHLKFKHTSIIKDYYEFSDDNNVVATLKCKGNALQLGEGSYNKKTYHFSAKGIFSLLGLVSTFTICVKENNASNTLATYGKNTLSFVNGDKYIFKKDPYKTINYWQDPNWKTIVRINSVDPDVFLSGTADSFVTADDKIEILILFGVFLINFTHRPKGV